MGEGMILFLLALLFLGVLFFIGFVEDREAKRYEGYDD